MRLCHNYVRSKLVGITKRLFAWAKDEELIPDTNALRVMTCRPMNATELGLDVRPRIEPVSDETIAETLPHLPTVVADIVRLQRETGMRPGEVCAMTWAAIDTTKRVWICEPPAHKTAHHGHTRRVRLGPAAQAVLIRYRDRPSNERVLSKGLGGQAARGAPSGPRFTDDPEPRSPGRRESAEGRDGAPR